MQYSRSAIVTRKINLTIRLEEDLIDKFDRLAIANSTTRSEEMRLALEAYSPVAPINQRLQQIEKDLAVIKKLL